MRTCLAARGTAAAANHPPGCDIYQPSRRDYLAEYYLEETFNFRVEFGDMIITLAAMLAVMAFLVGATFVGAEWSSGGMMNLLLWRPQRLRVLGTKLGALLVALTALTVPISAAWTGLFVALATQRGTMYSMTSGAWQSFVLMELRGLVLVLVAGAIGFALASIGRADGDGARLGDRRRHRAPGRPLLVAEPVGCAVRRGVPRTALDPGLDGQVGGGDRLGHLRLLERDGLRDRHVHDHLADGGRGAAGAGRSRCRCSHVDYA
nr:hypothetical protein GCM10020092_007510 [Actinoplanes digitatis]